MIEIKAYFGTWKQATIESAARLFLHIMRVWDKSVFNNHFRGVSYEELETYIRSND